MYKVPVNLLVSITNNQSVNTFIRNDILDALRSMKVDLTTDEPVDLLKLYNSLKSKEGIYEVAKLTPQFNEKVWLKIANFIYNKIKGHNIEYKNVIFQEASLPAIAASLRGSNGEHIKYTMSDFIHIVKAFIEYPNNINMYLDVIVFSSYSIYFKWITNELIVEKFYSDLNLVTSNLLAGEIVAIL